MSWRENRNFEACPPGVVQWRHISADHPYDGKPGLRTLWRTEHCNSDRWHYVENPCNCYSCGRPTIWEIVQWNHFRLQPAALERGTWRRDGRGIAAVLVTERKRIRDQREADAVGRAARGPQMTEQQDDSFYRYANRASRYWWQRHIGEYRVP